MINNQGRHQPSITWSSGPAPQGPSSALACRKTPALPSAPWSPARPIGGLGIPRNPDYNGASQPGVGYLQRCIHKGLRRSAGRMYLVPALKESGRIDLRTHARAFKVVFEGKKAVAVRYVDERSRTIHEVKVRKEVIVSGGTINSPRLLQLSGVGSGDLLKSLGVEVVHDLPAVGENFRDHCSVRIVARAKNSKTINE